MDYGLNVMYSREIISKYITMKPKNRNKTKKC